MEWLPHPDGSRAKVGLLNHFLAALNLPVGGVGRRAAAFNKRLGDLGHGRGFVSLQLRDRGGKAAWVATQSVYRAVYEFV